MQLKLLKCDWGMEHLGPMPDRLRAFAKAGYDGVSVQHRHGTARVRRPNKEPGSTTSR
jgi:hypothetical protein